MAQIGFTEKQEHVYDRFQEMRLAYQAKHGRTYAPGFLTVLMDAWESKEKGLSLRELLEATKKLDGLDEIEIAVLDAVLEECRPVIIKQSDGALYLQNSGIATANFGMTHDRSEAMIFDSPDQANAFLRQSGREVGEWILEPVN